MQLFRKGVMFLHKITFLRQLFLPRFKRKFKISVAGNHTKQNTTVLCVAKSCQLVPKVTVLWQGWPAMIAWEKNRHFLTSPLVSSRNDVWGRSADIPNWWRSLPRSGSCSWLAMSRRKFATANQKYYPDLGSEASSVWNFCARFSVRHFTEKTVVTSQNVDSFLRLALWPKGTFNQLKIGGIK